MTRDDRSIETPTQQRTSVASTGAAKPAGVPASVFEAGSLAKAAQAAKPARAARAADPLDPLAVAIKPGVPLPVAARGGVAVDRYGQLLDRMKPGDMVELPERQAKSLKSRATKGGHKAAIRRLGPALFGVWLLKRNPAAAA